MPYSLDGNCVKKESGEAVPGGCHKTHDEAVAHLRALEANVKDSALNEFSMVFTKARYNANEVNPNRRMQWRSVNSDTGSDLYQEQMSKELFYDFTHRINDNVPIPEAFESVICEGDWCGGMPYISIAHYKSGTDKINVPGIVDSVYVEGVKLKSRGFFDDTPMGRKCYEALKDDLVQQKSGNVFYRPVRISIGFLDLEHKHLAVQGGQEFTFERTDVGQLCPMCAQGIGNKVYTKGQLVHLAMTRVPANPRTEMNVERSMDEITTKKQDAESILGELANNLEEKSIASDVLVVRSDNEVGSDPAPAPNPFEHCYNPNDGGWNQECINGTMAKWMANMRTEIGTTVKSTLDEVMKSIGKLPDAKSVEATMEQTVEKVSLGGEAVPHKPFSFTQDGVTVMGDGNNTIPNPVKSDAADEPEAKDDKKEEAMEKSALDNAFAALKSLVEKRATVEEINQAFVGLGTEVEKAYVPEQTPVDANDLASIVKSAVEAAVAPLKIELATLKAGQATNTVSTGSVVKSKALSLNNTGMKPEDIIQRAAPQPTRQLSQIERIARKSTGVL